MRASRASLTSKRGGKADEKSVGHGLSGSAAMCAIWTQKQVSYGLPHSQRDQAPQTVLFTVVKHMATLAKGLQISKARFEGWRLPARQLGSSGLPLTQQTP